MKVDSRMADIPVLIYHSVAHENRYWWNHLSLPLNLFEKQLQYLAFHGYKTVTLSELHEMKKEGGALPHKTIALTFDDGFLDNWVYVYPLLEKYGAKATFFVSPEFVSPCGRLRPTLKDVQQGTVGIHDLEWCGYMSWNELRAILADGTVEIGSHGLSHSLYFSGPQLTGFHYPDDGCYWLEWNLFPERKRDWQTGYEGLENRLYGYPVYEHGKGLLVRRYYEDKKRAEALVRYVEDNGGTTFFHKPDWNLELMAFYEEYSRCNSIEETQESDKEYLDRVRWELIESRRLIKQNLGTEVNLFCWPNGGYNKEVCDVAIEEAGYKATVITHEKVAFPVESDVIICRTYFGQEYTGPLRDFRRKLRFISTVESRCGSGFMRGLVTIMQRSKRTLIPR